MLEDLYLKSCSVVYYPFREILPLMHNNHLSWLWEEEKIRQLLVDLGCQPLKCDKIFDSNCLAVKSLNPEQFKSIMNSTCVHFKLDHPISKKNDVLLLVDLLSRNMPSVTHCLIKWGIEGSRRSFR
jgi:hypothetical protein